MFSNILFPQLISKVFCNGVVLLAVMSVWVWQVANTFTVNDGRLNKSRVGCVESYKSMSQEELSRNIDASGRPGSGVYGLNVIWLGSFSECKKLTNSRYCLASFNAFFNVGGQNKVLYPLQWGMCLPKICTKENISKNLSFFLREVSKIAIMPFPGRSRNLKIECDERPKYTAAVVVTIILCGFFIALCLMATTLEITKCFSKQKGSDCSTANGIKNETSPFLEEEKPASEMKSCPKESWHDILDCFSLIRNTNAILNTNVGSSDLTYLHGIRVLSLFWIILFHIGATIIEAEIPMDNPIDASRLVAQRLSAMVIIYGSLAVDTFLVLSGLLVMYVTLRKLEKSQGEINWLKFYFNRFWRLTPIYMFVILFLTNLRGFMGDGPWLYKLRDTSPCSDYWWTNLLYVNNFHPAILIESCIVQSWYLALDMQFYLLSPILIIIFRRFGFRAFLGIGCIVVLASMITTGIMTGTKDVYPVFPFPTREDVRGFKQYQKDIYTKPYCRVSPYIIGMILGCLISKNLNRLSRIKWYMVLLFWSLSIATALSIVYAPYNAVKNDPHVWSVGEKVIFASLRYFLWSLCIAWMIMACQYGYAGLIKSILSVKFWIPLSRINYAAFILHFDIIHIVAWNNETAVHVTTFTLIMLFLAVLVLSYGFAFLFSVVVEFPCTNLGGLYLNKNKQR